MNMAMKNANWLAIGAAGFLLLSLSSRKVAAPAPLSYREKNDLDGGLPNISNLTLSYYRTGTSELVQESIPVPPPFVNEPNYRSYGPSTREVDPFAPKNDNVVRLSFTESSGNKVGTSVRVIADIAIKKTETKGTTTWTYPEKRKVSRVFKLGPGETGSFNIVPREYGEVSSIRYSIEVFPFRHSALDPEYTDTHRKFAPFIYNT